MEVGKTFSVPNERLSPRVIGWAQMVFEQFGTGEADALVVAQALGHASVGGAFNSKVAMLTGYGLVERRQGKIRATDVCRMVVSPRTSSEARDGVRSSLLRVSLWERLFREYTSKGRSLPADFAPELARIAGLTALEARNKAEWVRRAYSEDISFQASVEKARGSISAHQAAAGGGVRGANARVTIATRPMQAPEEGSPESQIMFVSRQDQIQISVPRTAKHIEMLRRFVESALREIEDDLSRGKKRVKKRKRPPGRRSR